MKILTAKIEDIKSVSATPGVAAKREIAFLVSTICVLDASDTSTIRDVQPMNSTCLVQIAILNSTVGRMAESCSTINSSLVVSIPKKPFTKVALLDEIVLK